MSGSIYLVSEDGTLVEMQEQPYAAEDLLQSLLASYPKLLSGDQVSGRTRRWVLVRREAALPSEMDGAGRWSVDHLFLDEEAVPTLVEVKRSTDTRIRREVVGQMLDYAANAVVYWPIESLRTAFENTCRAEGVAPDQKLTEFLEGGDLDAFWLRAKTNLQAGRIRLVFVADVIPAELRRIVEFLNEQMDPAEVLAVEVRQFIGAGRKTLVPRTIGQTAEAEIKKGREEKQWDENLFLEELAKRSPEEVAIAGRILEWSRTSGLRVWWGRGKQYGSFIPVLDHAGLGYSFIAVWTTGSLQVQFGYMHRRPPFSDEARRREFAERLNRIPGVRIPEDSLTRFPSAQLSVFKSPGALDQLISALDWAADEVQKFAAEIQPV